MNPAGQRASATQLSRRAFLGLVGAAAAGACAPTPRAGGGPHGTGRIDLVYQDWRTPWFPGMARELLRPFQAAHPNIRVYYTPDPEHVEERMLSDFQSGTAPDVLAGCCDFFPTWAQAGQLLDLRPYVEADLDRSITEDWDAELMYQYTNNDSNSPLYDYDQHLITTGLVWKF